MHFLECPKIPGFALLPVLLAFSLVTASLASAEDSDLWPALRNYRYGDGEDIVYSLRDSVYAASQRPEGRATAARRHPDGGLVVQSGLQPVRIEWKPPAQGN